MGLWLDGSSLFPFLKRGITSADFNLFGKIPSHIHLLKILHKNGAMTWELNFINFVCGQSDLVDFLLSNNLIIFKMSSVTIGCRNKELQFLFLGAAEVLLLCFLFIFSDKAGPIPVKNLLNIFATLVGSFVIFPFSSDIDKLLLDFFLLFKFMISFIVCHNFFVLD